MDHELVLTYRAHNEAKKSILWCSRKFELYVFRIANKQDKKETLNKAEVVEELHLEGLVNKYECPCNIVSSRSPVEKLISLARMDWKSRQDRSRACLSLHQIAYSALPAYVEIANKMMKGGQEWLFNVLDLNYEFIEYRVLKDVATQAAQGELHQRARVLEQIHQR